MSEFFKVWFMCWLVLFVGIIGVLTFGLYIPTWVTEYSKKYLPYDYYKGE